MERQNVDTNIHEKNVFRWKLNWKWKKIVDAWKYTSKLQQENQEPLKLPVVAARPANLRQTQKWVEVDFHRKTPFVILSH